jgi:VIT1/CCC1 family predicted Fe2+/Mn2+ transporter
MDHHHHHHVETHRKSSEVLKDFVLGMSDGLTVPFALAAGLSGAVDSTHIIVVAGIAEIAAGAIAMGLGGYLAAKTEAEHYEAEYRREVREVEEVPHHEAAETSEILKDFGVPETQVPAIVTALRNHPRKWVEFMMRFELNLEKPDPKRIYQSPITIGAAYAFAGLLPLIPYMFLSKVTTALIYSIIITLTALLGFGGFKGYFTGRNIFRTALQTMLIGAAAALAAFVIAGLISR